MNKEKFIAQIQSGHTCEYIYENESNETTGMIKVWLHDSNIILTHEECPKGSQYDESLYIKDKVHNFSSFEELGDFFDKNSIAYNKFKS